MFACFRIEGSVPTAISGWFGTVTSLRVSSFQKWTWLPVCRTGPHPVDPFLLINRPDVAGRYPLNLEKVPGQYAGEPVYPSQLKKREKKKNACPGTRDFDSPAS
jgi:hypothetical protein